jgi:RNA polymerase sigma-70 factor (ECF subfamily)
MEVWQEIRKNRERGAERLVAEYGNRLYAAAVLLCGNDQDAEELVFSTFNQAVKKIRLFDSSRNFFTWLYAIMLNFHRMNRRRRRIEEVPMGSAEDLPVPVAGAARAVYAASDEVEKAIRALSPPLREAIVLRYFADKTVEEIAAALDIPVGTVKSRLHNARTELANLLPQMAGRRVSLPPHCNAKEES